MAKGTVVWFNDSKGYGWIEDQKGEKYFAHYHEISSSKKLKTLKSGQTVQFKSTALPSSAPSMGAEFAATSIKIIEK